MHKPGEMALRDDVWLWSLFRESHLSAADAKLEAVREFVIYRNKEAVTLLWKHRTEYKKWLNDYRSTSEQQEIRVAKLNRRYEEFLSKRLGQKAIVFRVSFRAVGHQRVPLTNETGDEDLGDILGSSELLASLQHVWEQEPQFYIILFGETSHSLDQFHRISVDATAEWVSDPA